MRASTASKRSLQARNDQIASHAFQLTSDLCCSAAFADSYDEILDPLLVKLLEAVEATENDKDYQEAIDARKNICSTNSFASAMTLGAHAQFPTHFTRRN